MPATSDNPIPLPPDLAPRLAHILATARTVAIEPALDPDQRRRRLLRKLAFSLSPRQHERVTAHCEEAARITLRLASCMRLPRSACEQARLVALLHDISALLTAEDQPQAPAVSAAICEALGLDEPTRLAVAQQHARFDGPEMPHPAARILAVAHALIPSAGDTAASHALACTRALAHLRRERGRIYDPDAVIAAHLLAPTAMSLAA